MRTALAPITAARELSDRRRAVVGAAPTRMVASADTPQERARRRLVAVILVIYLLAIFEGSLRKYVVPQFAQYVFFVRDPFLIYAYALATLFGLWPKDNLLFKISVFMCGFGVLLFCLQTAVYGFDNTRVLLGIYGWRSYFFYVPLAFLIGAQFRRADLRRFAKVTLALAVPIAVLVVLQFAAPPGAAINVGVAEEQELQFKSVGITVERIRTNGPFTSPAGQQQFIAVAFAFLLAMLLSSKNRLGVAFLAITGSATLTCLALSGSRGAMLLCALIGVFAVGLATLGRGMAIKAKALLLPAALGLAAIALYPIVFPDGFATFITRWDSAAQAEAGTPGGIFGRSVLGLLHFTRLFGEVPTFGYGLGYGGNASQILGATVDGVSPGKLVEADFSRHMVDLGPVFGIVYIGYRIAVVVWLAWLVVQATRSDADPVAMLLFAYVSYTVIFNQLTGNGTINLFGWLFTGLCIAAARESLQLRRAATATRAKAAGRPRWPASLTSRPRPTLTTKDRRS